jgi:hypothetical protein
MRNIVFAVTVALLSSAIPLFAQTNQVAQPKSTYEPWDWTKYQDKFGGHGNELAPQQGDFLWSVGPALLVGKADLPDLASHSTWATSYGGYVSTEYFVLRAVSIEAQFAAIDDAVKVSGDGLNATATAFDVGLGAKLYPLQIAGPSEFRLQPYLLAGIDGVFFDVRATYGGVDISRFASIDPVGIGQIGAGMAILIDSQWAVIVDGAYFHSIADTDGRITSIGSTPVGFMGVLAKAGVRYRF